ncbi:hypothetical protein LZ31DRAFT_294479 [Colletotrichum somersetense]|nr:hypothetical protein LZ31DRAFT_294479 [Colletotrichum somersetense]
MSSIGRGFFKRNESFFLLVCCLLTQGSEYTGVYRVPCFVGAYERGKSWNGQPGVSLQRRPKYEYKAVRSFLGVRSQPGFINLVALYARGPRTTRRC